MNIPVVGASLSKMFPSESSSRKKKLEIEKQKLLDDEVLGCKQSMEVFELGFSMVEKGLQPSIQRIEDDFMPLCRETGNDPNSNWIEEGWNNEQNMDSTDLFEFSNSSVQVFDLTVVEQIPHVDENGLNLLDKTVENTEHQVKEKLEFNKKPAMNIHSSPANVKECCFMDPSSKTKCRTPVDMDGSTLVLLDCNHYSCIYHLFPYTRASIVCPVCSNVSNMDAIMPRWYDMDALEDSQTSF